MFVCVTSEKLFCRITGRLVAKTEPAVVRHSEGRRFTKGIGALLTAPALERGKKSTVVV